MNRKTAQIFEQKNEAPRTVKGSMGFAPYFIMLNAVHFIWVLVGVSIPKQSRKIIVFAPNEPYFYFSTNSFDDAILKTLSKNRGSLDEKIGYIM